MLAALKPTAYLVNTARAALADYDALADALREQRIAGAALDVYPQEPLPPDSPLLALDNVVLSPHLAGASLDVPRHHSRADRRRPVARAARRAAAAPARPRRLGAAPLSVALVTGGSGGIGRAVCEQLAAHGTAVAVHYNRGRAAAEELAARLGGDRGGCRPRLAVRDRTSSSRPSPRARPRRRSSSTTPA